MPKDFQVTITNPVRAAEWERILGTTTVYVRSPLPKLANLPGTGEALIYELDLELLDDDQRERLIQHLAVKFELSEDFVRQSLDEHGVPILGDDCYITVHNPQRWFS